MKQFSIVGYFAAIAVLAPPALSACTATSEQVRPPRDQFFFPTGLAVSPDERVLFVANANSELRYDSGSVNVVDLAAADALAEAWLADRSPPAGASCAADPLTPHILNCDEAEVVMGESTVRVGNFTTEVSYQELASGDLRLFVPVRGDPSVTWIDYAAADHSLSCGGTGTLPLCDDEHRITRLLGDPLQSRISEEPFGIHVDSGNTYAVVTHLSSGVVSLIDTPPDGAPPVLVDNIGGLFSPDPGTGARGAIGVAGRTPGDPESLIYVTSRTESRIQMLYVHRPMGAGLPRILPTDYFFLSAVRPSSDARGIRFGADGDRAYIVNRNPPMLHVYDTAVDVTGVPRNAPSRAVEICGEASVVAVADTGRGERAFVSCFLAGQVWVIDPERATIDAIIEVGRGPNAMAISPQRQWLYVANFLEDTIAMVDLTPGAPSEYRVAMRLGRPRQLGGD